MWLHQLVFGLVLAIAPACGAALLYFSKKWDREAEDRTRRACGFPPADERQRLGSTFNVERSTKQVSASERRLPTAEPDVMAILAGNLLFLGVLFSLTGLLLWAGYYGTKVQREMREHRH